MKNSADITVLGAGSYGSALAISLASNGHKTLLWG
ncbi:MAG: glycerol-3-phosphate dehydrogenase, partial [Shewanella sp.]